MGSTRGECRGGSGRRPPCGVEGGDPGGVTRGWRRDDAGTREQVWNALPVQLRRNEVRFKQLLVEEAGVSWRKEGSGGSKAHRYWLINDPRDNGLAS